MMDLLATADGLLAYTPPMNERQRFTSPRDSQRRRDVATPAEGRQF
jgi:hypothetical protein